MKKAYKAYKKAYNVYLVKCSENKNSAAIVFNILKISKDSIKKSGRLDLCQNLLFFLHCSRD